MQLLPTWDLWYPSSPKHQLASAPALALCTKCWWRVWRNAAIQVPARLLVACLTRKLSLAVYVKNGSHDPILPQICVACPRMPRAKGDTIMHPLSKCRRNRQHAASSKSVWNRSEISLKPINRSRSALSYGGFPIIQLGFGSSIYVVFWDWNRSETHWNHQSRQRFGPVLLRKCHECWYLGDITDSVLISLVLINTQITKIRVCPRWAVDEPYTGRIQQKCCVLVGSKASPRWAVYLPYRAEKVVEIYLNSACLLYTASIRLILVKP